MSDADNKEEDYLEVVLEYRVHNPPNTKGRLNHAGDDLLDMECFLVLLDTDHVLGEGDRLAIHLNASISTLQVSLHLVDLLEAELGQHVRHTLSLLLEGLADGSLQSI